MEKKKKRKPGEAGEASTSETGVIRLIQVYEWKALAIWTRNTLQAFRHTRTNRCPGITANMLLFVAQRRRKKNSFPSCLKGSNQ